MTNVENSIKAVRQWQRHHLLRQYGENGHVLPENMTLSAELDRIIDAAQKAITMSAPSREIPRRIDRNRMTAAELAIIDAQTIVERAGADPLLTDATALLTQARAKVADFVDRPAT